MKHTLDDVQQYWDSHLNLTQFFPDEEVAVGSDEFWRQLDASMDRYAYKEAVLERFASEAGGGELLEIGCGLGLELSRLSKLGFDVTGLDLAPNAVAVAHANLQRQGLTGRAVVGNAEALEFADETFDAVYSSGVIQHTPSIEAAIAQIWRVLKPGGRILIILYHRHSWFNLLQRLSNTNVEFESGDAPIINSYSRGELRSLFQRFRNLEIETEYYYPKPTTRGGTLARLYNGVFVPFMGALPKAVAQPFGWHLVLTAEK
ncbi:MAG: class I SAM-dependent methyltransferase [Deltaproteobacteria bacterium]|nr:class I SAM-dependent methyltransferase [Deltaproteobacteria bacterium]MBW2361426.1 class I SAM-dependent methyltransferase [Deltaproteobacteria bacterium]